MVQDKKLLQSAGVVFGLGLLIKSGFDFWQRVKLLKNVQDFDFTIKDNNYHVTQIISKSSKKFNVGDQIGNNVLLRVDSILDHVNRINVLEAVADNTFGYNKLTPNPLGIGVGSFGSREVLENYSSTKNLLKNVGIDSFRSSGRGKNFAVQFSVLTKDEPVYLGGKFSDKEIFVYDHVAKRPQEIVTSRDNMMTYFVLGSVVLFILALHFATNLIDKKFNPQ